LQPTDIQQWSEFAFPYCQQLVFSTLFFVWHAWVVEIGIACFSITSCVAALHTTDPLGLFLWQVWHPLKKC
jgi:hypothetical protein